MEFSDGDEVREYQVCEASWLLTKENEYMGTRTYISPDKTLGVTFYRGTRTGTIYRNE